MTSGFTGEQPTSPCMVDHRLKGQNGGGQQRSYLTEKNGLPESSDDSHAASRG